MPERRAPAFDPYAILQALEDHRVQYVLIGGFARVLQGTEEITRGIDIVPSTRGDNLQRLDTAMQQLGATQPNGRKIVLSEATFGERPVIPLVTENGDMKVVPTP